MRLDDVSLRPSLILSAQEELKEEQDAPSLKTYAKMLSIHNSYPTAMHCRKVAGNKV